MFSQYFDRRFFEMQEFIYHFNKTVAAINRNFHLLGLSQLPTQKGVIGFEQLMQYKLRREDRRLSEELRDHFV